MKTLLIFFSALLFSASAFAQKDIYISSKKEEKTVKAITKRDTSVKLAATSKYIYLGPGFGLDYGGLGLKMEIMVSDWMSLFATGGTNFQGFNFNIGSSLKILPKNNVTPTLSIMYGYNGALIIKDYNNTVVATKTYYGLSVGGGIDFLLGKNRNKLSLGILAPIRSSAFKADIATTNATVLPVAFSLGFGFALL